MGKLKLSASLSHFLKLARRGSFPAGSSGEQVAQRLASEVLSGVPRLDTQAVHGFLDFILFSSTYPNAAQDLLDGLDVEEVEKKVTS